MDNLEQRTGKNEPQRYSYKKPKEGFFRRHMLATYLVLNFSLIPLPITNCCDI